MRKVRRYVAAIALGLLSGVPAGAQQGRGGDAVAPRGPQFLVATTARAVPKVVNPLRVPLLARRISVDLRGMTMAAALGRVADQAGLTLVYGEDLLPSGQSVHLKADEISVAAALSAVLVGAGVDLVLSPGNRMTLIKRGGSIPVPGQGSVAGRITDEKTGAGLPGTEVFLLNTRWRTTADSAGRYHLDAVDAGTYTLTVRRLGYTKQDRSITIAEGKTDTVDVALTPVATSLTDLVTTATGERRRVELANDITTINADSVVQWQPVASITDILETRVPGLTVQHTSGAPGDPSRLRLRGASSPLQSNDPIVVVDGVRVYAASDRNRNLAGENYNTPSPLDYLDPNSVEKIEVLKGPSAATLYGPDAANGVIVITTKKGKAGPAQWSASAVHGVSNTEGDFPNLMLRWGHALGNNTPVACPINNKVALSGVDCDADSTVGYQLLNDPALTVLDQGQRTSLSLGVSGGSSALRYSVRGSYGTTTGLPKLPDYEAAQYQGLTGTAPPDWMRHPQHLMQWNVTSSLAIDLGTKAQVSLSSVLGRTTQQRSSLEQQLGNMMMTYFDRASGTYYRPSGDNIKAVTGDVLTDYFTKVTDAATNLINAVNLSWRPRGWLSVTGKAGLNVTHRDDQTWLPRGLEQTTSVDSGGHAYYGRGNSIVGSLDLQGLARAPLGRGFQFEFAMGANYISTSTNDLSIRTFGLAEGGNTPGSQVEKPTLGQRDDATFGWYMQPSINNQRIYLNLGLRLDGGSTYGSGVNGLELPKFPKLGFSYNLSEESFYPFSAVIPELRLRVSYGKASRQPGPTDRLRLYTAPTSTWLQGQYVTASQLTTLGNTDLRPEVTGEFEGGFDATFFGSRRLSLSVTGYRKTTEDALVSFPVPLSVYGSAMIERNIGVVRNSGIEIQTTAPLVRSNVLTWVTSAIYSRNRNVVVKLGPGVDPFYANDGARVAPGYPLFGRWAVPITGYADANANGIVEQGEIVLGDTAVYVGATLPNYQVDFHTDLTLWRAFTVSAGLQYQDGLSQRNDVAKNLVVFSSGRNDPTVSANEQVATSTVTDYNWIQTVNTLRFNSLALTYRLSPLMARRLGAQALSIAVQGTNLGLHTNYRGLDPNVNASYRGNAVSDNGVLPEPRAWQITVNATY